MHKIAVVGPNLPSKTKRDIEDRVAADFSSRGVNADPSYKVLGDAVPDTATARATLASHGYDGALVLSVTPVEAKVKQAPPDNFYAVPYGTPYMTQTYDWRRLVTEQYADVESNLWDLRGGKAVWGSKTRLENFTGNDFAKRVSRNVVPAVTDKGFVAR